MSGPQHRTPEYRLAYRSLKAAQRAGQWLTCAEPVCLMDSRDIAPWMPAHVCHDETGTVILGPGHRRCNITEVNERRAREGSRMRSRGSCRDCGELCTGERCWDCWQRSKHKPKVSRPAKAMRSCKECETETARPSGYCSDACYMRAYMRQRYRRSVGIPDDAPLYPKRLDI